MKSKTSVNNKIRYSKSDSEKQVLIEGAYSEKHKWTLILENRNSLRELGDLITAVREDILGMQLYQPVEGINAEVQS